MTVAEIRDSEHGYSSSDMKGELGDDDFMYGSPAVTYTVQRLSAATASVEFIVDQAGLPESDTLTLEVAGHAFPFSARQPASITTTWFWELPNEWDSSGNEFPVGTMVTVCLRTATQVCPSGDMMTPLSTDATLSGLSVTGGGSELVTNFASGTTSYTASVTNSVDEVTVTATENHASADGEIQDADGNALADADTNAAGHQVALAVGANTIVVEVTAEDGSTSQDYTVTVTRAGAVPSLSIADAAASEGDDLSFTVTLSAAAAAEVTATWTASIGTGDTAVAADLGTTTTATVSVTMGTTTGTFTVSTTEDSIDEADETCTLTLSNVSSNAQLAADPTAKGTITDDVGTPTNCTLNTGDVWCGTVTVGTQTAGTTTTGHGFSSITGNSFGTLTDNSGDQTFTYGTQTYVVSRVVVGVGSSFAGDTGIPRPAVQP